MGRDSPTKGDPPMEGAPSAACRNCGAPRSGPFCHDCGQRFLDGPLTFRDIGSEVARVFMDLDRGLVYTVRMMTLQPNRVVRRYLDGERRRFMSPIAYFLISVTLSVLMVGLFREEFITRLTDGVTDAELNVAATVLGVETAREYAEMIHRYSTEYQTYLNAAGVLPVAVALRMFFPNRTMAEWTVFAAFVSAQQILYNALLIPLFPLVSLGVYSAISVTVQVGVIAWALTDMGRPEDSRAKMALLGVVTYIIGILIASAAFLAAMAAVGVATGVPPELITP